MANVAVFGAGMMAGGMIGRMLENGEQVRVWNRTFAKAQALEKLGAVAVADPVATLQGAERVHILLADDASVDGLLDKIAAAIPKGAVTIDHTTVTAHGTKARAERMRKAGLAFLHAPVFMSPQGMRDASGIVLVAGPPEVRARVKPALEKMGAELWDLGDRAEKAAAFKLMGNQMTLFITAGLADMFVLAKSTGVSPAEALTIFEHINPAGAIKYRGTKMAAADFTPTFELTMARKDARVMIETAEAGGAPLAILPAIARRMDELIARGLGDKDPGVLAIDAVT